MSIFWKREKQIKEKLTRYFEVVDRAFDQFENEVRLAVRVLEP